jgi:hypothetical protein
MIAVWDDHEFSNDCWGAHATYTNGLRDEYQPEHFHAGDFKTGRVEGIREIGERLAEHFPSAGPRDENELPDELELVRHVHEP